MAVFEIAFKRTEKFEGANVWSRIDGDSGKETWSGISRAANPRWEGWKLLDAIPNKQTGKKYWSNEVAPNFIPIILFIELLFQTL